MRGGQLARGLQVPLSALRRVVGEDVLVARLVLAYTVLQLAVLGWDLPSAVSWENDGVAPRDFLHGVVENLTWGHAHRYPLFHNLLLLLLCAPVLLGFVLAGSLSVPTITARVLSVPCMTAVTITVRLVHVGMAACSLLVLARIARRLFGRTAGRFALLCVMSCLTISYYGRASNLDGPYMFWTILALDRVLDVLERGETRDYLLLGFFVAASVATKDQAYAAYVLTLPLYLFVLPWLSSARAAAGSRHLGLLVRSGASFLASYAVMTGAIVNPAGFVTRVRMLLGPNSEDWRTYAHGATGLWLNLRDLWAAQTVFFWNAGVVAACWLGVALAALRMVGPGAGSRVPALLPMTAGLSSVVAFTLPVARCEHRFMLPLSVWLCVYGGAAIAWCWRSSWTRVLAALACAALVLSFWQCVCLALSQWGDGRREVERYLAGLPPGSTVEVYGSNVFFPRFDTSQNAPYRVQRVGKEPVSARARLPGVREIQASYGQLGWRRPDVIVVERGFAQRFLPRRLRPGEVVSLEWQRAQADEDALRYFRSAADGTLAGYRRALVANAGLPGWAAALGGKPVRIHDSTADTLWLFVQER
ncbi:MAG: glycosyltransferase family 39 protein [Polyangiales bacterium]